MVPAVLKAFCSFSMFLILRSICQASRHTRIFMWFHVNGKNMIPPRENSCESLLKSETSNRVTLLVGFYVMVDENKCWVDAKTFLFVDT